MFDRFGPRVPTLFISPYIEEGTVVRAEGETPFDHTSIIKTLCERWGLDGLMQRDRAAPSFASVLTRPVSEPRLETPDVEPRPYERLPEPKAHQSPVGHLAHQAIELSCHVAGEVKPTVHTTGDAIRHLFRHSKSREDSQSSEPPARAQCLGGVRCESVLSSFALPRAPDAWSQRESNYGSAERRCHDSRALEAVQ